MEWSVHWDGGEDWVAEASYQKGLSQFPPRCHEVGPIDSDERWKLPLADINPLTPFHLSHLVKRKGRARFHLTKKSPPIHRILPISFGRQGAEKNTTVQSLLMNN